MAEAAATTTRPTRTRKPAATAAKAAPAKAAPAATPAKQEAVNVTKFKLELEHVGTTKQYEKFAAPDNFKGVVVGNLYAPIGTERMVVFVIGAGNDGTDTE